MSENRRFDRVFSTSSYSAERTTTSVDDDVAADSNFISTEAVWDWTIFSSVYEALLRRNDVVDRTYPNYPHVYNWRINELSVDTIQDFIDIAERSAHFLDPSIFLIVLYVSYKRSATTIYIDATARSRVFSRALGVFLTLLLERLVTFGKDSNKFMEKVYDYFDRSACCIFLYKEINLKDFLDNVAKVLATRLSDDSYESTRDLFKAKVSRLRRRRVIRVWSEDDAVIRAKLLFSKIFFTIAMRIATIHFREITRELRSVMSLMYGSFVSIGNLVMALPFSFFVSIREISKNSVTPFETFAPEIQEAVRSFVKNFRILDSDISEFEREPDDFGNLIAPYWRYVDAKLHAFLNAYGFVGKLKGNERAHRDIFLSMKIFGSVPFREIPRLRRDFKTDEIEKRFSSFRSYEIYRAVRDAFNLFRTTDIDNERVYSYHPTYEDLRKLVRLDVDVDSDKNDDDEASANKERCAVCLSEEYEKTVFLPCFHDSCSSCAVRIDTCPLCTGPIIARVANDEGIYDDLQLCVLYEIYHVFRTYFDSFCDNAL